MTSNNSYFVIKHTPSNSVQMENSKNLLISRSKSNSEYAEQLKKRLEEAGFNLRDSALDECIDKVIKQEKINSGETEDLKSLLQECIDWADTLVVIIDKETNKENTVSVEAELANQKGRNIVAVLLPECSDNDIPEAVKGYVSGGIVSSKNLQIIDVISGKTEIWENNDGTTRTIPLTGKPKKRKC